MDINLLHSWLILITFMVKVTIMVDFLKVVRMVFWSGVVGPDTFIMVDYFIYGWNLHISLTYPIFDLLSHLLFVATGKSSLRA